MILILLCLGWLIGLYLGLVAGGAAAPGDPLLQQTEPWLWLLVLLSVVAAVLARREGMLWITALSVGLAVMGIWRSFSVIPAADPLAEISGQVTLRGTISSRPEPRDASLLITLDVEQLQRGAARESIKSRVLVRADRYGEWGYGDRVAARGELRPVDPSSGYWATYLARQGIHATIEYPTLRLEERPSSFDFQRTIDGIRSRLDELCGRLLPEPQASLLAGVLVGSRAAMPDDFKDDLNVTSTSHIVAVSGFNVTLVAILAELLALRFLGRRKATLAAIAAVWLYSLLTGLPPSATRAAIMATMALLSILVGRGGDALAFLCFSAALMAGYDPQLLYDLGFQLSFLATGGLVLLEPVMRRLLARLPGWLATSLSVPLAAQLAVMPVLAGSFHTLSLVSLLTNLLIAPALPPLMAIGGVVAVLGAASESLGQIVAPAAWLFLTYIVVVIRWTAQLPNASLTTGNLGALPVAIYYLGLLAVALWPLPEFRAGRERALFLVSGLPRWVLVGGVAAMASAVVLLMADRPDGKTHVYFLDVGQGDATLIRGPQGHTILVDGGPSPLALTGALGRHLAFMDRSLDVVVVTGYAEDRLAGLVEAARRHPIGMVLEPAGPADKRASRAWQDLLEERRVPVVIAQAGQRIDLGDDAWLEVVYASGSETREGVMALKLVESGTSVLMAGDLSRAAQSDLAGKAPGRVEILRVPGHGAAGALDEWLMQAIAPKVALVSVKSDNRQGLPSESTLDQLRAVALFRTDRQGTVEVSIGRDGYELYKER